MVEYGRYATIWSSLFIFVLWPSLLGYGLFLIVAVSSVVDSHRVARMELFSILLFYLAFYLTALMFYNIPFPFTTSVPLCCLGDLLIYVILIFLLKSDLLRNIGFVQRVPNGGWLGAPMLFYALIAVYWSLRKRLIRDEDLPLGPLFLQYPRVLFISLLILM